MNNISWSFLDSYVVAVYRCGVLSRHEYCNCTYVDLLAARDRICNGKT